MSTAQLSPPLADGTRLFDYEIAGVLEQARFVTTYLARDAAGTEVLVREFMPAEFALREDGTVRAREPEDRTPLRFWLRSFLDKAVLLQKLNHPGLIGVLRQFEANGTGYYVTERVAGETLDKILEREGTLSEAQLRRLLAPVLSGLEQAHAVGLLHRDIRPQNVIVRPDDSAVLSNFGELRAPIRFKARTVFSAGTPPYAAPEEFYMAGPHGPWTDLYALGATAYRVVTGQAPPEARSRATGPGLASVAARAQVRCSDALVAAIDAALLLNAEQRPQSLAAWREILQGTGEAVAEAEPAAAADLLPSAARRRSPLPLVLGAVVVAAAALGGYFMLRPHGGAPAPGASPQAASPAAVQAAAAPAASPDAPNAAPAPAAAQDNAGLDRLAFDLMAKEKKVEDAQKQLQVQHDQAVQEARAAAAAGKTATAAVPAGPAPVELAAAEHLKQLQDELERLKKEKEVQQTQVAASAPASPASAPARSGPDWPTWYKQATGTVRQNLHYPQTSLEAGEEGDILVKVRLRRDGGIVNTAMQQRSPYSALNGEALNVFTRVGRFSPLPSDYQPSSAEVDVTIPINFKLNE